MGFWDNEGFWAATGGGLQGALRVGGSNASVADWLAAFGAGSGMAVDQRQAELDRAKLLEEQRRREEEDRAFQMHERQIRLQQEQEAAAQTLRENQANQIRDARAHEFDPGFVGPVNPQPLPQEAFAQPGQYADAQAARMKVQEQQSQEQAQYEANKAILTEKGLGYLADAGPDMAALAVKEIVKSEAKNAGNPEGGAGALTPSQQLARERFDFAQQQAADKRAAKIDAGPEKERTLWKNKLEDAMKLEAQLDPFGEPDAQMEKARKRVEAVWGPEPSGPAAAKTKPVALPQFAGSLPTEKAKGANVTGSTAPPKIAVTPTAKRLEAVDTSLNQVLPNIPPEVRAKVKARVMQLMYQKNMTLDQVMQALAAESQGTPFGAPIQ
jgi:hypothetical protein